LQAAADETGMAPGAAPEETQTETTGEPSAAEILDSILGVSGEGDSQKPFGNEEITEDQAVSMNRE
jgi:hypothetical protein